MTKQSNILVIGGTGKTGRKVVAGLNRQNQNVRIGSRSSDPAFDWHDPATWPKALADMDKVYIVYYPDLAVPGALEAYNSMMKSAGVPSDYIWLFDYLFREVLSKEENQAVSADVEKVLGRKARGFSEFARETAKTGVWSPSVSVL